MYTKMLLYSDTLYKKMKVDTLMRYERGICVNNKMICTGNKFLLNTSVLLEFMCILNN